MKVYFLLFVLIFTSVIENIQCTPIVFKTNMDLSQRNMINNHFNIDESVNGQDSPEVTKTFIKNNFNYGSCSQIPDSEVIILHLFDKQELFKNQSQMLISRNFGKTFVSLKLTSSGKNIIIDDYLVTKTLIVFMNRKRPVIAAFSHDMALLFSAVPNESIYNFYEHPHLSGVYANRNANRISISVNNCKLFKFVSAMCSNFNWMDDSTGNYLILKKSFITKKSSLYFGNAFKTLVHTVIAKKCDKMMKKDDLIFFLVQEHNAIFSVLKNLTTQRITLPSKLIIKDFSITSSDSLEIYMVVVQAETNKNIVFRGLKENLRFVRVIDNVNHGLILGEYCVDMYYHKVLPGIIISNFKRSNHSNVAYETMISLDDGNHWKKPLFSANKISLTSVDCVKLECKFVLHMDCQFHFMAKHYLAFSENSPSNLAAHGRIYQKNKDKPIQGLFTSVDGGISWTYVLGGHHIPNLLNDGGVLFTAPELTRSLFYSFNEGDSFTEYKMGGSFYIITAFSFKSINDKKSIVIGHNTTHWGNFHFDFTKSLGKDCKPSDYVTFSPRFPRQKSCFQGQKMKYYKKLQSSICASIITTLPVITPVRCPCTSQDFGCEFGFRMRHQECVPDPDHDPKANVPEKFCSTGEWATEYTGHTSISGDKCIRTYEGNGEKHVVCNFRKNNAAFTILKGVNMKFLKSDPFAPLLFDVPPEIKLSKTAGDFAIDHKRGCAYYIENSITISRLCWFNGGPKTELFPEIVYQGILIRNLQFDHIGDNIFFIDSGALRMFSVTRYYVRTVHNPTPKNILSYKLIPILGHILISDTSVKGIIEKDYYGIEKNTYKTTLQPEHLHFCSHKLIYFIAAQTIFQLDDKKKQTEFGKLEKGMAIGLEEIHEQIFAVYRDHMTIHGFKIEFPNINYYDKYEGKSKLTGLCEKMDCPFICAPIASDKVKCECPEEMEEVKGKCVCQKKYPKCELCSAKEFKCDNNECILLSYKCDGFKDCADGSDEQKCDYHCNQAQFKCTSEKSCIDRSLVCNGMKDCKDGEDELKCPPIVKCKKEEFQCSNFHCIPISKKCDLVNDCGDFSDEENCKNHLCTAQQFSCADGGECIAKAAVCDKKFDCTDWSDEKDCQSFPVDKNSTCQFRCNDDSCIKSNQVCDHRTDCPTGEDEIWCDLQIPCKPPLISCEYSMGCYKPEEKCDGISDCMCGSDEYECPGSTNLKKCDGITHLAFKCKIENMCLFYQYVCDGTADCKDGSDEHNCRKNARVHKVTIEHTRHSNSVIRWQSINTEEKVKFEIIIHTYASSEPMTVIAASDTHFKLPNFAACERVIIAIRVAENEPSTYAFGYKQFDVDHTAPTDVLITNNTLHWKTDHFYCLSKINYYVCHAKGKVYDNFSIGEQVKLKPNTSQCQVATCPLVISGYFCTKLVSSIVGPHKKNGHHRFSHSALVAILMLTLILATIALTVVGYKVRTYIQLRGAREYIGGDLTVTQAEMEMLSDLSDDDEPMDI